MQRFESQIDPSDQFVRAAACLGAAVLLSWLAGCGKGMAPVTQTAPATQNPQTYFAPYVQGAITGVQSPLTYIIDDVAGAFSQTTYQPVETQAGPQVLNAGVLTAGQRGLRSLGITAHYTVDSNVSPPAYEAISYPNPGLPGSFAVELAGQAGGLVQMVGQPVQPLVAAMQCPGSSAQTYQFVTIPAQLTYQIPTNRSNPTFPPIYEQKDTWDPKTDTAYGSVDIVSSGSTVTFQKIQQYTLPPISETGTPTPPTPPAQSPSASVTGACGPTFFGNMTNVPGSLVITDPGGQNQSTPPQAHIGIGPTGLLVEDNGNGPGFLASTAPGLPYLPYDNILGAGTGAVGLPKPSSALDTGTVAGKQYMGYIYAAGTAEVDDSSGKLISPSMPWSSNLVSFGFSSMPSGCPPVTPSTTPSALIYGGDFPVNPKTGLPDPGPGNSNNPNYPYGNCDFVIDLGAQDAANSGLYPQAQVTLGTSYPGYSPSIKYPFSAVAISGQLGSQYVIFVIGMDSVQPWAIYLLQSSN